MDTGEMRNRIRNSIALLESYRSFSPMVDDGISSLRFIEDCVAEPTPRKMEEARLRLAKLVEAIGPYRSFVPEVASTLDMLTGWFEGATPAP
jgi:hypothetical protein